MSRRTLPVVLAAAGLLCLLLSGPAAQAVDAPISAWWSRVATTTPTDEAPAALPVPAPTTPDTVPSGVTVPEGQLLVESTPEGATAVAAARWQLADGESSPSLTLPVGEGSTLTPESIVLACKAAAPWSAPEANPGAWDTKPLVDASRCVNGVIAEDLTTVSFGLQPLVSGNDLDVVLVAGKVAGAEALAGIPVEADRSTFRWVFDAPTSESLKVVSGSDFDQGAGDEFVLAPTPTAISPPADGGGQSPAIVAPPPTTGSSSSPIVSGVEEPIAAPALEPQDLAPSVPDVSDAVRATSTADAERTIGFILLLLAAAAAAWAHLSNEQSLAIGLGRFRTAVPATVAAAGASVPAATPTVGGLSRFARERTTPPSRLS